jgi:tRNA(Phe) wybutosine-synthesizing methylase Tyw3
LVTFQDFISSIREWLSKREDKFLWIKVYPFILHVGCKDLSTAEELVKVGLISGMKESGIFELRNRIMVRIEGVDKLELPIAFKDRLLVEEEYLRVIYHTAVIRFLRNLKKVILFTKNLRETFFKEKITNLDLKGLESKIRQHEDLAKEIALKD